MKILFANLPWWSQDSGKLRQGIRAGSRWPFTKTPAHEPGQFQFGGYLPYPFFLGHAAGYFKSQFTDALVAVRDSVARGETYMDFGLSLKADIPDFIVIETASPSWAHDKEVIRKMIAPLGIKVILCGTLPESEHGAILEQFPCVHAILRGEYDKLIGKSVFGERGVYEHDLLTSEEMKNPPFPIWDEACLDHYWDPCPEGQKAPQIQMWTSRGCPYSCVFCVWPAVMTGNDPDGHGKRTVRLNSPDYVESYIRHMLTLCDYKSVYLDDDTFNLSQKHTRLICGVMSKIGLPWSAMCRADTVDLETWRMMKDSGCFGVKIGFESGSQWVIDHIVNKRLDIAKAHQTCQVLQQDVGMKVHTTWTIGLPGETNEQKQETLALIQKMYADGSHTTHQLSGTATVDGTPLDRIAHGEHLDKYDGATNEGFVVSPDGQAKVEAMR